MEQNHSYIVDSLELNLFFARIMKEHALFLKLGFLPPAARLAEEGGRFLRQFEGLLARAIALSGEIVTTRVLDSGELVTEFTHTAECQTQRLGGTLIDQRLTARELRLVGREACKPLRPSRALVSQVRQLNRDALALVNGLINYKERILRGVTDCRLFTANYPLLIEHILREARLYRAYLLELEGMGDRGRRELRDSEMFWNRIMMEHALFIRGLLDPGEEELIGTANGFAKEYRRLLEASAAANDKMIQSGEALPLTKKFRQFKRAGVEGIEGCQIRSLILPLLADHVLREANHYIRLLEE